MAAGVAPLINQSVLAATARCSQAAPESRSSGSLLGKPPVKQGCLHPSAELAAPQADSPPLPLFILDAPPPSPSSIVPPVPNYSLLLFQLILQNSQLDWIN